MDEGFWGVVGWAAAISTALATGVSTVAALWWRREDRAEADWALQGGGASWVKHDRYGPPHGPTATALVANAGDGTAFRMHVTGRLCAVSMWRSAPSNNVGITRQAVELLPSVRPGEDIQLTVECAPDSWESAEVLIVWTRSPTWKKKTRTLAIPLREIATKPEPDE